MQWKLGRNDIRGWTKKIFGSAEYLLVRECKDYYTYTEQERTK